MLLFQHVVVPRSPAHARRRTFDQNSDAIILARSSVGEMLVAVDEARAKAPLVPRNILRRDRRLGLDRRLGRDPRAIVLRGFTLRKTCNLSVPIAARRLKVENCALP